MQEEMEIRPVLGAAAQQAGSGVAGPQLADGQVVMGKVVSAGPHEADLEIGGKLMSVQTDVPLAEGDQLALKVSIGGAGQVRLTMLSLTGSSVSLLSDSNIAALLEQVDLPSDRPYRDGARLLLAQADTVDPVALRELMRQAPADRPAAALLLARGLPVTPAALALVRGQDPGASFGKELARTLTESGALQDGPPELASLILPDHADATFLSSALATLVEVFTPPEAAIARHLEAAPSGSAPTGLPPDEATGESSPEPAAGRPSGAPQDPSRAPSSGPATGLAERAGPGTLEPQVGAAPPAGDQEPVPGQPQAPVTDPGPGGQGNPATGPAGALPQADPLGTAPQAPAQAPPAGTASRSALPQAPLPPGDGPQAAPATGSLPVLAAPPAPLPVGAAGQPLQGKPRGNSSTHPEGTAPGREGPAKGAGTGSDPEPVASGQAPELRLASNLVVALAKAIAGRATDSRQTSRTRGGKVVLGPAAPSAQADPRPEAGSPLAELHQQIRFQQLENAATTRQLQEVRLPLIFGANRGELVVQRYQGNAKEPEGHARIVVALDMARLGPLKVDLMYLRGHVSGNLIVADAATADYLAGRLDELTSSIAGVGVGVGHLAVSTPSETPAAAPVGARFDLKL